MDLLKTVQSPKFRSSPQNLNSKWSWNVVEVKQENQPKWLQEKDRCEVHVKCLISPSSGCFHLTLASYHPSVQSQLTYGWQICELWRLCGSSASRLLEHPQCHGWRSPGSKSECHQKDIPGSPWGDQQFFVCESQVQQQERRGLP